MFKLCATMNRGKIDVIPITMATIVHWNFWYEHTFCLRLFSLKEFVLKLKVEPRNRKPDKIMIDAWLVFLLLFLSFIVGVETQVFNICVSHLSFRREHRDILMRFGKKKFKSLGKLYLALNVDDVNPYNLFNMRLKTYSNKNNAHTHTLSLSLSLAHATKTKKKENIII